MENVRYSGDCQFQEMPLRGTMVGAMPVSFKGGGGGVVDFCLG